MAGQGPLRLHSLHVCHMLRHACRGGPTICIKASSNVQELETLRGELAQARAAATALEADKAQLEALRGELAQAQATAAALEADKAALEARDAGLAGERDALLAEKARSVGLGL